MTTHGQRRAVEFPHIDADIDVQIFNAELNLLEIVFRHLYGDDIVETAITNIEARKEPPTSRYPLDDEIRRLVPRAPKKN